MKGSLANDPIMLERSIRLFRHLEHQNPSIISESIAGALMVQQFQRRRRIGVSEYSWLRGCDRVKIFNGVDICCAKVEKLRSFELAKRLRTRSFLRLILAFKRCFEPEPKKLVLLL